MIINPQSVRAAINKEDVREIKRCGAGGNRKLNGLNFKRLGKFRIVSYLIIFENIIAIVVPVDLEETRLAMVSVPESNFFKRKT